MGSVPRTLELFYDVLSPYSWLAFEVTPGSSFARGLGRQRQREGSANSAGTSVS